MFVKDVMTSNPETCLAAQSCASAGQIMIRRNCGFVPIIDSPISRRVIGVVTDRDILTHLVQTGEPADSLPVKACMTSPVKTVDAGADLMDAVELMEKAAVQRLPIVENGRLVGVLSLKDIALVARKEWASSGPHRVEHRLTDIIEAIAASR